jgi:VWFA-related protein
MRRIALIFVLSAVTVLFAQQSAQVPQGTQQKPSDLSDSVPADQSAPAPATQPPSDSAINTENPAEKFVSRAREVNVIFTVTDKRGKFVKDLGKENFEVYDARKRVPEIRAFDTETNLPLRVGLLIDASNSIREQFKFEQEAAILFLNDIVRPKTDQAFIIGFDTTPEVMQDWTSSEEKLAKGVREIRPGGGTALYDAVYYACRDKINKLQERAPVRRAIILLSDGDDNQSRATLNEAIQKAQEAEVIIYTISTTFAPNEDKGDKVLKRISEETGGRTFHPFKIDQVSDAFHDIQDELRAQYALSYKPPDLVADGSYHQIEIAVPKHKSLKVRARKGYYAPKPQ